MAIERRRFQRVPFDVDVAYRPAADAAPAGTEEGRITEAVLREIMDNCIFVTHQVFKLSSIDENLGRFLVTGFLFNLVILLYRGFEKDVGNDAQGTEDAQVH
jgi:hypothetical protein